MTGFLLSAVTAAAAMALLLPALRHRVVDVPNHRSSHAVPIPRGGGLAVMAGVLAALALQAGSPDRAALLGVVLPALALAALGFVDDVRTLGGGPRLVLQVACFAALVAIVDAGVDGRAVGWLAGVVCVFLCVGYLNAFNFMDGVNGISGLNAAVAGAWFAWLGHELDHHALLVLGAAVAGAAVGFLPWNAPRARVFLGDVGSYGLGALIAGGTFLAFAAGVPVVLCLGPLAPYLVDTGTALVRRALGGRSLMTAHREHVYQRLVDGGWSHLAAAALTASLAAVLCALAWAGHDATQPAVRLAAAAGAAALLAAYLLLPVALQRSARVPA